ncbi:uncharacterized protein EV420DRAFT_147331 [Desarmillaria tabescens]|uniref:Uncharacterized protein n=1 Tax=Armillaria tabescens TaxID=1929756 RepID=A0AA39NAJ5_ARMTA|nr:uncharacterized protein EV420DRAFT_147331 [Desarmillaria tabescens]KAK0462085.1 hypothetical protein EV420DRAFT_147331 [Desarmillaria tabescens]
MSSIPSFRMKTGGGRKTVTFDTYPSASPPPRGVKRSIEEVDTCLDDSEVVEGRRHPMWTATDRLASASITCDVNTFAPASLWASPWASHSVYDELTENAMAANVPVEVAMGRRFDIASSQTTTSGLYVEITRIISRLIEGNITRNDLIGGLQRVASQLKHWD